VRDAETYPSMHGVDVVSFNGGVGGGKRAEGNAGDNQGEYGMFRGNLLSRLNCDFG
jgi:hypothetical protein